MYVLSYVMPPIDGARHGKATVSEVVTQRQFAADIAGDKLISMGESTMVARRFALSLAERDTGTEWVHPRTGIIFRIDTTDAPPNACECCGRLVKPGGHAFAGTEDAHCDGCYTWGDDSKISCSPHHTAHPNPWSDDAQGARFHMEIVFENDEGETDSDYRFASTADHEMWDDEDNALIAWPGLTADQIIEVKIIEVNKES